MAWDRFKSIVAHFHINDNSLAIQKGNVSHDPLHKVRPLLESVCIKCQNAYHPQENLTIDEGYANLEDDLPSGSICQKELIRMASNCICFAKHNLAISGIMMYSVARKIKIYLQ